MAVPFPYGSRAKENEELGKSLESMPPVMRERIFKTAYSKRPGTGRSALIAAQQAMPKATPEAMQSVLQDTIGPTLPPIKLHQPASGYSSLGHISLTEEADQTRPVAVRAHEASHALQPQGTKNAVQYDSESSVAALQQELAPALTGELAEIEARRRSGGVVPETAVPLSSTYKPSARWMADQARERGLYNGQSMEKLLNTPAGQQWLRTVGREAPTPKQQQLPEVPQMEVLQVANPVNPYLGTGRSAPKPGAVKYQPGMTLGSVLFPTPSEDQDPTVDPYELRLARERANSWSGKIGRTIADELLPIGIGGVIGPRVPTSIKPNPAVRAPSTAARTGVVPKPPQPSVVPIDPKPPLFRPEPVAEPPRAINPGAPGEKFGPKPSGNMDSRWMHPYKPIYGSGRIDQMPKPPVAEPSPVPRTPTTAAPTLVVKQTPNTALSTNVASTGNLPVEVVKPPMYGPEIDAAIKYRNAISKPTIVSTPNVPTKALQAAASTPVVKQPAVGAAQVRVTEPSMTARPRVIEPTMTAKPPAPSRLKPVVFGNQEPAYGPMRAEFAPAPEVPGFKFKMPRSVTEAATSARQAASKTAEVIGGKLNTKMRKAAAIGGLGAAAYAANAMTKGSGDSADDYVPAAVPQPTTATPTAAPAPVAQQEAAERLNGLTRTGSRNAPKLMSEGGYVPGKDIVANDGVHHHGSKIVVPLGHPVLRANGVTSSDDAEYTYGKGYRSVSAEDWKRTGGAVDGTWRQSEGVSMRGLPRTPQTSSSDWEGELEALQAQRALENTMREVRNSGVSQQPVVPPPPAPGDTTPVPVPPKPTSQRGRLSRPGGLIPRGPKPGEQAYSERVTPIVGQDGAPNDKPLFEPRGFDGRQMVASELNGLLDFDRKDKYMDPSVYARNHVAKMPIPAREQPAAQVPEQASNQRAIPKLPSQSNESIADMLGVSNVPAPPAQQVTDAKSFEELKRKYAAGEVDAFGRPIETDSNGIKRLVGVDPESVPAPFDEIPKPPSQSNESISGMLGVTPASQTRKLPRITPVGGVLTDLPRDTAAVPYIKDMVEAFNPVEGGLTSNSPGIKRYSQSGIYQDEQGRFYSQPDYRSPVLVPRMGGGTPSVNTQTVGGKVRPEDQAYIDASNESIRRTGLAFPNPSGYDNQGRRKTNVGGVTPSLVARTGDMSGEDATRVLQSMNLRNRMEQLAEQRANSQGRLRPQQDAMTGGYELADIDGEKFVREKRPASFAGSQAGIGEASARRLGFQQTGNQYSYSPLTAEAANMSPAQRRAIERVKAQQDASRQGGPQASFASWKKEKDNRPLPTPGTTEVTDPATGRTHVVTADDKGNVTVNSQGADAGDGFQVVSNPDRQKEYNDQRNQVLAERQQRLVANRLQREEDRRNFMTKPFGDGDVMENAARMEILRGGPLTLQALDYLKSTNESKDRRYGVDQTTSAQRDIGRWESDDRRLDQFVRRDNARLENQTRLLELFQRGDISADTLRKEYEIARMNEQGEDRRAELHATTSEKVADITSGAKDTGKAKDSEQNRILQRIAMLESQLKEAKDPEVRNQITDNLRVENENLNALRTSGSSGSSDVPRPPTMPPAVERDDKQIEVLIDEAIKNGFTGEAGQQWLMQRGLTPRKLKEWYDRNDVTWVGKAREWTFNNRENLDKLKERRNAALAFIKGKK